MNGMHHPNCAFENLKPSSVEGCFRPHVEYCQLKGNLNSVHHATASVVVCADLS